MKEVKKNKTKLNKIIAEVAHDLGLDKKLVRQVITEVFKEVAILLILKGKPVLIRRFVKFVFAIRTAKKIKETLNKLITKKK